MLSRKANANDSAIFYLTGYWNNSDGRTGGYHC